MTYLKIYFALVFTLLINKSYSQDTSCVYKSRGFIFMSEYNYLYDYHGEEIKKLGFHDFYFPALSVDKGNFLDSNLQITINNGLRLTFFKERNLLKRKGFSIRCIDSSKCYKFEKFYFLPVKIEYKISLDSEPFICRKSFFELNINNGAHVKFNYLNFKLTILKIEMAQ